MHATKTLQALSLTLILAASGASAAVVEREFSASPGGRVVFNLESGGSIEVRGWSESRVTVEADLGNSRPEEIGLSIAQKGQDVTIRTEDPPRGWDHLNLSFRVMVPAEFGVSVDTSGGGVTLADLEGLFEGQTMGGNLRLSKLRGRIDLSTMGGDVGLTESTIDGSVSTMGGNVNLNDVTGALHVKTMGGHLVLDSVSGGVKVETMVGDVSYTHRGGSQGRTGDGVVRLSTMGGSIKVDDAPDGADVETMGGDITVGKAAEFVKASTMGGDIEIGEADGSIHANTMGGDVNARIVEQGGAANRDILLSSQGGDITLIVPDGFSMDVDVEIEWERGHGQPPRIESDFPLTVETTSSPRRDGETRGRRGDYRVITGTGKHGGGRHKVTIRTVDGDVTIRKG